MLMPLSLLSLHPFLTRSRDWGECQTPSVIWHWEYGCQQRQQGDSNPLRLCSEASSLPLGYTATIFGFAKSSLKEFLEGLKGCRSTEKAASWPLMCVCGPLKLGPGDQYSPCTYLWLSIRNIVSPAPVLEVPYSLERVTC